MSPSRDFLGALPSIKTIRLSSYTTLFLTLSFLTACSTGHQLNCEGKAGALHQALANQNQERALQILSSGNDSYTALIVASYWDYPAIVALLLDRGANIEEQNNGGRTALMRAAFKRHQDAVALLRKQRGQ